MGADGLQLRLHEGNRTTVARLMTPDGPVIRKQGRGTGGAARIRAERALLERLSAVPGVPRLAEAGQPDPGQPDSGATLTMADTGHISLVELTERGLPEPPWLVGFARDLARVLAGVHAAGVLHRDVSVGNVLVRPDGTDPVLADYDLATTFAEDRPDFTHPSEIVGTLPYLSPEATGRTGRAVDQRSDLYSLGAVLYELATGRPPFGYQQQDLLELVHAQLALAPVPPSELNPDLPPMLSAILLRLLEKEPDDRYAGAEGLAHDLARLAATPDLEFPLGSRDFPPRLSAPSRLVGRDSEIAVLRKAFDGIQSGGTARGVLVAGPPGVGKSALLNQLRPLVTTSGGGWFVSGKFDQYRHDQLDDAVVQCLRMLGRLLLAEPDEACEARRERLLAALGSSAAHLAATLPEFASLLRVAPQPATGDPAELAQRSYQAFVELLGAVASPARPVVMVIDDLQWASSFALGALDALLTDDRLAGVLVVGGYRDVEVGPTHPFAAITARWHRLHAIAATLSLSNLPEADLGTFLAEMLRLPDGPAAGLAEAIAVHAKGNPFDTVELVNALRREGGLVLTDTGWQWDACDVRRFIGSGEVLQLIDQRVARLPEVTRNLLQTMACLGGTVELPLLREVLGARASDPEGPVATAEAGLEGDWIPALEEGLLVLDRAGTPALRFRHDRVQQAVYASLEPHDQRRRRLALARTLVGRGEQSVAVAAEQYLAAVEELTDPAERRRVVALFERAAQRALQVANHEVAERYLASGVTLLSAGGGGDDADPCLRMHDADPCLRMHDADPCLRMQRERHAALYGLRRFDDADEVFAWLEAQGGDVVAQARVAAVQIGSLVNRGRLGEALDLGAATLMRLGNPVPGGQDLGPQIGRGLELLRAWAARGEEPDLARPEGHDPRVQAIGLIVNRLVPAAFFSGSPLMVWLITEAARLWDVHGPSADLVGPLAHATFAFVAAAGDYRTGHTVVRRMLAESAGRGYELAHAQTLFLHSLSGSWFEPAAVTAGYGRQAREGLIRAGDLWNASFTYFSAIDHVMGAAQVLAELEAEVDAGLAFTRRTGNEMSTATLVVYRQAIRALQGRTAAWGALDDETFDAQACLAGLGSNATAAANLHACSALVAAVFGDQEALDRHSAALMPLLPYVEATQATTQARLWRVLALADRVRAGSPGGSTEALAEPGSTEALAELGSTEALVELDSCVAWIAQRAAGAPANFGYLHAFVLAERAWALGDLPGAAASFDRACEVGWSGHAWGYRALIVERYARFQLSRDLAYLGELTLQQACQLYAALGADGKVAQLELEFPFLQDVHVATPGAGRPVSVRQSSIAMSSQNVDLVAILRAFQILSTETNMERLQDRVAEVLALLTGATQVRLVLRDDDSGGWSLPRTDGGEQRMMPLAEAVAGGLVPTSLFRYVARTGETAVVDDAGGDARFAADPYFAGLKRCAMLAVPVLSRGGLRAVLLLENRLARGAFTARRLDVVQLIAGELGICLENMLAERFRSLVQRSAELTLVCARTAVVSYASAACADLLGRQEQQVVGHRLGELFAVEDRTAVGQQVEQVRPGEPVTLTARIEHSDGQPRWAEVTFTDLTADAAVGGVMVRLRDVTERHQLEIELRHAQKLESVGQLASGIAHEINTPMQFITTNLHFLTDAFGELATASSGGTAGPASESVAELLTEIPAALAETVEGAERVVTIVRAMKAFGHPGGESKSWVDLNEAIRNTLVVAANEIRPSADVVTDFGELPPVWCNLGDVNQVVLNLVINAAQAMAEKLAAGGARGTLTVRTRSEGEGVAIEVEDTGVGIPAEIADRVFDQFFTTKDVGVGTGQGLALTHALVHDRHGGTVSLASVPGDGTTFTVRLPNHRD